MGYSTRYTASVGGPKATYDRFIEDAQDGDQTFGNYGLELYFWLDSNSFDEMSWYDHQKETEELSLKYPNLLFSLEGEGEESGDIWKSWTRNGKTISAKAKIIFEPAGDLDELLPLDPKAEAREAAEASKAANARLEKAKREAEEALHRARLAATKAQRDLKKLEELAVPTAPVPYAEPARNEEANLA